MVAMIEYLLLLVALLRATVRARDDLDAENLLLRQQLAVLTRPTRKRPRLRARDRLFRSVARLVRRDWRRHLVLVTPETVARWHRRGWALFWRWRSRTRAGHPRLSAEVRDLIARNIASESGHPQHLLNNVAIDPTREGIGGVGMERHRSRRSAAATPTSTTSPGSRALSRNTRRHSFGKQGWRLRRCWPHERRQARHNQRRPRQGLPDESCKQQNYSGLGGPVSAALGASRRH
jgi:hypothetical protein